MYTFNKVDGNIHISDEEFEKIVSKFKQLKHLNLCREDGNWDIDYQIQVRSSMKLFRESQKWGSSLGKNLTKLISSFELLPKTLMSLSLRNVSLGKTEKTVLQKLFKSCPNL